MNPTQPSPASVSKVTGFVQPTHDRAARGMKALVEDRLADARRNTEAIPDVLSSDRAWKQYLAGLIAFRSGELTAALKALHKAAALALECGNRGEGGGEMFRLACAALACLGRVHRRCERFQEAIESHGLGYQLAGEHGSADEQWDSALELGLDFHTSQRLDEAQAWFARAADHARHAWEQPIAKQARAEEKRSAALLASGRHQQALEAAQAARDLWQSHSPGCIESFRAEAELGHVMLIQGQESIDIDSARANELLHRATELLAHSRNELAAFGEQAAADVRSCDEQLDFARRLTAMLAG